MALHRRTLGGIGIVDLLHDLGGALVHLRVDLFFLLQAGGVFVEFLDEGVDVGDDVLEHRDVGRVGDGFLQLGGQLQRLGGGLDAAALGLLLAAGLQARARFVQALQHQAVELADLGGLLQQFLTLLALGILEFIGAVIGQAGLQDVQAVRGAVHRPGGSVQRQATALAGLLEAGEGGWVVGHALLHPRHGRGLVGLGLEPRHGVVERAGVLAQALGGSVAGVDHEVLFALAHLQQLAVDGRHVAEQVEALGNRPQRGDTDHRHQGGQQQHQAEPDGQFLRRSHIGQTTLHEGNHGISPHPQWRCRKSSKVS